MGESIVAKSLMFPGKQPRSVGLAGLGGWGVLWVGRSVGWVGPDCEALVGSSEGV